MLGSRRAWLGVLLLAGVGCVDAQEEDTDTDGTVVDGKADGVTDFDLHLSTSGTALKAKESPKLPGAPSGSTAFSCPTQRKTDDGWTLLCTRGSEQLALTLGPTERAGAAIYRKSVSSPDKRAYYRCTTTAMVSDAWPGDLHCTSKPPRGTVNGQLISPFASSLEDVGIFNAHLVSESGSTKLYRGMKPFRDSDFDDLRDLGVEAVLIFKKPTSATEVEDETEALDPIGVPASRVVNVEFPWKDFPDFETPCRQTVRSLNQLVTWTSSGKTTFFHCTVGEDRTGYLAGLYRLLTETATEHDIFDSELCERGYSAGNPQKPFTAVVKEVDTDLTPLFLKMAFKISKGELTETSLDESVCEADPADDAAFTGARWKASNYRCTMSSRYRL